MAVGIKVGAVVHLLGDGDFLTAFFSTIAGNLEPDVWGSRFPTVMGPLYEGDLRPERVRQAREELRRIREELSQLPHDRVVWDLDDTDARPPWGDDIAEDITGLGNYFVTMDGKDLFDVLDASLEHAEATGRGATLKPVGSMGARPGAQPS